MAEIKIFDITNSKISKENISFNFDNKANLENPKAVAYTIDWQLRKKRSGSAKTKQMSEISGTTAKPYKQKGTGHARQGSKRSVQFRGGRTCFGPTPRSFAFSLPKKIVKKSLIDILRSKIKTEKLALFEKGTDFVKSSQIDNLLSNNEVKNALFIYEKKEGENINLSIRNLRNINSLDFTSINVYDIAKSDLIVLEKNLLDKFKALIN